MLMSTIIKNTASFGFAYFANDWFMTQGFEKPFFILMGVALFLLLIPSVAMVCVSKQHRCCITISKLTILRAVHLGKEDEIVGA